MKRPRMERRRWSLTLRTKLYALAAALLVIAVLFAATATIPLVRLGNQIEQADRQVGAGLAAEGFARHVGIWAWHVAVLVATGDDEEVEEIHDSRRAALVAVNRWAEIDNDVDDTQAAESTRATFLQLDEVAIDIIDAVDRGDRAAATQLFREGFLGRVGEELAIPLNGRRAREVGDARDAFVVLAAEAASGRPIGTDFISDHALLAGHELSMVRAAGAYVRFWALYSQFLAMALFDDSEIDAAMLGLWTQLAQNELDAMTRLADHHPDAGSVSEMLDRIAHADTGVRATAAGVIGPLAQGDLDMATAAFEIFHHEVDRHLADVDGVAQDGGERIVTAMSALVSDARRASLLKAAFALALFGFAVSAGLGAHRTGLRIAQTSGAVERIADGDIAAHVDVHGTDELAQLGRTVNDLASSLGVARHKEALALKRTAEATENERIQLAAELHDGPIQRLTAVAYTIERIKGRFDRGELDDAGDMIAVTRKKVAEEVTELRRMLSDLRPPVLDESGLGPALRDYVADFQRRQGVGCALDISTVEDLPQELETPMYRIVQEALSNVVKHAHASHVDVRLEQSNGDVRLSITDDGVGFDLPKQEAEPGGSFGLFGMSERVRVAGGDLRIESTPGAGTTIVATFERQEEV